ncbi:MAG TPA: glycosyltransferase family 2 protein [Anaerolineales bacterium]|nr:glycosyltransferase family 2 protein [Anaerolineales bacterium]
MPAARSPRYARPPTLTVVAPVFNERESLPELYRRLRAVMEGLGEPWELILVDDGCSDGSDQAMDDLARRDRRVRAIHFARNFGHQIAVTAGLDQARGQAVVIIDADLQDPPEVIPDLVAQWRNGFEVVYGVRTERQGETWFKTMTASLFYRVVYRITDVRIPLDTGDFRLLDRRVVDALSHMRERHRFLRGMAAWVGFRQTGVPYKRAARHAGVTKYPFRKMVRLALNAVTSFSYFPLQIATYLGFACAAASAVAILVVIALRLSGNQAFFGQATTLSAVLFLGGIQLISLGLIGEYLGRIYDEVKGRPLYVLRSDPPRNEPRRGAKTKR